MLKLDSAVVRVSTSVGVLPSAIVGGYVTAALSAGLLGADPEAPAGLVPE